MLCNGRCCFQRCCSLYCKFFCCQCFIVVCRYGNGIDTGFYVFQCDGFAIFAYYIVNSIAAFIALMIYCFFRAVAVFQHNAAEVFQKIPFGICYCDDNILPFADRCCYRKGQVFFCFLRIINGNNIAEVACCIYCDFIFTDFQCACFDCNLIAFDGISICAQFLPVIIQIQLCNLAHVSICIFKGNFNVLIFLCLAYCSLGCFQSAIGIAVLNITQQTIFQNLFYCGRSVRCCFHIACRNIFCVAKPFGTCYLCIINCIQIACMGVISCITLIKYCVADYIVPVIYYLCCCRAGYTHFFQQQCICQQVAIEQQVCGNHIAAAAVGRTTAAAAACSVCHYVIRCGLINYSCLLGGYILAACYVEALAEFLKAVATDCDGIIAVIGQVIHAFFCVHIVIQNKQIAEKEIIVDITQFLCIPLRVCQCYAFDGSCDCIRHILYIEMQVSAGNCGFSQKECRCFFIYHMDGNQYGCLIAAIGFYAYIVTTVIAEIALSDGNGQFANLIVIVGNIPCRCIGQIGVDCVLVFVILYQLQLVNAVEPCFFFIGIEVEHNGYITYNLAKSFAILYFRIGGVIGMCVCFFCQIKGCSCGIDTNIAVLIVVCQIIIPCCNSTMRPYILRQVLCTCINGCRTAAVQIDGLCFITALDNNLLGCPYQRQLCDCAICGHLGQFRCYICAVNRYGSYFFYAIAILECQRQPRTHIGAFYHCFFCIHDSLCGCCAAAIGAAAAMGAAAGGGTAAAGCFLSIGFGGFIGFGFFFIFIIRSSGGAIKFLHTIQQLCKFFSCYLLCGAKGLILIA